MDDSEVGLNEMAGADRGAAHPNPAYDYLTGFLPRKLKDLFKWCEYLTFNSAHIYAAMRKFGELVVTQVEYGGTNEALKRNWRGLYEKNLKIKSAVLRALIDKHVYGNHFTSMYFPFIRNLKCPDCETMTNITHAEYKFEIKKLQFLFRCKKCRKTVSGKVVDRKLISKEKIHIIRWDPKLIDVDYNPITGHTVYYYAIPEDIKEKVRKGNKHLINSMPMEFLQAIKNDRLFEFDKDAIFHMKVSSPSGIDQQWGFPPLASTLKLFLYTMVLRKANEAISLEHIVPFRILHPSQTNGLDPTQSINLDRWKEEIKRGIKRFRRDPLHMIFAPVAVGVTNIGGDGRAMLTLGEVQEADKSIMAAMGIPPEFLYGGLTKTGMEGTLRLVENQLQGDADDANDMLQWYTDKISRYLSWERVETSLTELQLIDDTETKNLLISLATGANGMPQIISLTTIAERIGVDLPKERERRKQEQMDELRFQIDVKNETQKLQNTLAQQVQQQVQGNAGLNYDQQAVIAAADQMAQQLSQVDVGQRRSQLHSLQTEDAVMYAVVIQRLEQLQTSQNMDLKDSAGKGGGV